MKRWKIGILSTAVLGAGCADFDTRSGAECCHEGNPFLANGWGLFLVNVGTPNLFGHTSLYLSRNALRDPILADFVYNNHKSDFKSLVCNGLPSDYQGTCNSLVDDKWTEFRNDWIDAFWSSQCLQVRIYHRDRSIDLITPNNSSDFCRDDYKQGVDPCPSPTWSDDWDTCNGA